MTLKASDLRGLTMRPEPAPWVKPDPFGGIDVVGNAALPDGTVWREVNSDRLQVSLDVLDYLKRNRRFPDGVTMYEVDPTAIRQPLTQPILGDDLFGSFKREAMGGWEDSLSAAGRLDDQVLRTLHDSSVVAATIGGWEVRLVPSYSIDGTPSPLEYMALYADQNTQRTYVGHDTYETLSYDQAALEQFYEDMTKGVGMRRMVREAGKYRDAALAELRAKGMDVVEPTGDTLDTLLAEANSLLVQAGGLARKPTSLQLQIFAERLAALNEGVVVAAEKLDRVKAAADLAALAVADSTE